MRRCSPGPSRPQPAAAPVPGNQLFSPSSHTAVRDCSFDPYGWPGTRSLGGQQRLEAALAM